MGIWAERPKALITDTGPPLTLCTIVSKRLAWHPFFAFFTNTCGNILPVTTWTRNSQLVNQKKRLISWAQRGTLKLFCPVTRPGVPGSTGPRPEQKAMLMCLFLFLLSCWCHAHNLLPPRTQTTRNFCQDSGARRPGIIVRRYHKGGFFWELLPNTMQVRIDTYLRYVQTGLDIVTYQMQCLHSHI